MVNKQIKKCILALSILGLAVPGSTMGVNFNKEDIKKIIQYVSKIKMLPIATECLLTGLTFASFNKNYMWNTMKDIDTRINFGNTPNPAIIKVSDLVNRFHNLMKLQNDVNAATKFMCSLLFLFALDVMPLFTQYRSAVNWANTNSDIIPIPLHLLSGFLGISVKFLYDKYTENKTITLATILLEKGIIKKEIKQQMPIVFLDAQNETLGTNNVELEDTFLNELYNENNQEESNHDIMVFTGQENKLETKQDTKKRTFYHATKKK